MVETVLDRLLKAYGKESLSVVQLRDLLGISYQAAKKVHQGGGISVETAKRVAKDTGKPVVWLMDGTEHAASPPLPLPPKFEDRRMLTPEQWEQWQAFSIAATPAERQAIMERYEMVKQMAEHTYTAALKAKPTSKKRSDK